jgi:hypothetical protein
MEPLSFLSGVAMTMGALLTVLNIREKLWPKPPKPHPLESVIRDIAAAIRE